jgi:hypothetical protein
VDKKDDVTLKDDEDDKLNKFIDRHLGKIILLAVVIVFGTYFYWSWTHPDTSDCIYSDEGCQGDNRWGQ